MLESKQEELAKGLDHNHFKATDCSLSRWKCRFAMKFKEAHGEKVSPDALKC
jgi:hypothetical protein